MALGEDGGETRRGTGRAPAGEAGRNAQAAPQLRPSLLMNGISINYLSRWLGHSSIQTTLIYLELVPDPTGSLAMVP